MNKVIKVFSIMCLIIFSGEAFADKPTVYTSIGRDFVNSDIICRIINKGRKEHGLRCSTEIGGTVVSALKEKKVDFVFIAEEEFKNSNVNDKIYALFRTPNNKIMVALSEIDQNKVEIMVQEIVRQRNNYVRVFEGDKYKNVVNSYDINFMKNTGIIPLHPAAKQYYTNQSK